MVDNTDPSRPVVLHDIAKVDQAAYDIDKSNLEDRLTVDEDRITILETDVTGLKTNSIQEILLNGVPVPQGDNVAELTIDYVTPPELQSGLNTKVNRSIGVVVKTNGLTLDPVTGVLCTNVNLADGSTTTSTVPVDLADGLGITELKALDIEHIYFVREENIPSMASLVSVPLGNLYRPGVSGVPAFTDNIVLVMIESTNYTDYNIPGDNYISAIGEVLSLDSSSVTVAFTRIGATKIYNQYNGYYSGTSVLSSL